jgi:hypothetical protein
MRVNLSLTRWPCHGTPTQEVQVSVEYALTCRFSGVKNCSISGKSAFCGNLVCGQEKISGHGGAIAGKAHGIFCVQSGHQQNMCRCLRVEIIESDNIFIAKNNVSWDLAFNDSTKNTVLI